jgi:formate/nitrite transporter FocA (FNT family)
MPQLVPFYFIKEFDSQVLSGVINILGLLLRITIVILFFNLLGLYIAYYFYYINKGMSGVRCPTCLANGQ